jgi:hypothetical protein
MRFTVKVEWQQEDGTVTKASGDHQSERDARTHRVVTGPAESAGPPQARKGVLSRFKVQFWSVSERSPDNRSKKQEREINTAVAPYCLGT